MTHEGNSQRTPRVLVAEDDDDLRSLVAEQLRRDGCEVFEAATGDEALSVISDVVAGSGPADELELIVMDLRMPGLSGIEVMSLMRNMQCPTPVLVVTAYPDQSLFEQVERLGGVVLPKPFGFARLSAAANAAMKRARLGV
jgi:two-component system response regulator (stage 0 sporulation protein F)